MSDARRIGDPQILADLGCDLQPLHLAAAENLFCSKRNGHSFIVDPFDRLLSRLKISRLIKFRIIGKISFWDKPQQFSSADRRRHIVELSVLLPRQPHKDQAVLFSGVKNNFVQFMLCLLQQIFLPEQIPARIACNAQLRKHDNFCPVFLRLIDHCADLLFVVSAVRHSPFWSHNRHFQKTIKHCISLLCFCLYLLFFKISLSSSTENS